MAHIGLNRYSPMAYFYLYCGCHMDKYRELSEMPKKQSLKFLTELVQKQECQDFLKDVMVRSMLADFEQNIFRLAIRNYWNIDNVQIWTFYNTDGGIYDALTRTIEKRYSQYGVQFEYEDSPIELQISKIQDRKPPKGKKMTNAQKIISWCEMQEHGTIFKIKTLLSDIGISNDSFKETRKSNSTIKKMFNEMKTDKQGYYKIS